MNIVSPRDSGCYPRIRNTGVITSLQQQPSSIFITMPVLKRVHTIYAGGRKCVCGCVCEGGGRTHLVQVSLLHGGVHEDDLCVQCKVYSVQCTMYVENMKQKCASVCNKCVLFMLMWTRCERKSGREGETEESGAEEEDGLMCNRERESVCYAKK